MLVRAAQADPQAFAALYERYYPRILAYVRRRTRDRAEVEDVAAQTFLHAWLALPRYEDRGAPFAAWLFRIAANQVHEQERRRARDASIVSTWSTERRQGTPALERWEQRAWVGAHLATLAPERRRAVCWRYYEGRAPREIAARLGRSEGATKALLHRSLRTLRAQMTAEARC
jgi:RNA polymerase sigma-70 factor (ECF subfamily)